MGKLITIDGLDGSGKGTQSDLLCEWLRSRGKRVRELSFPCYGQKSAVPVELYLGGALGPRPEDTNAFAASSFFSIDRYISYRTDWKKDYGKISCDRGVTCKGKDYQEVFGKKL